MADPWKTHRDSEQGERLMLWACAGIGAAYLTADPQKIRNALDTYRAAVEVCGGDVPCLPGPLEHDGASYRKLLETLLEVVGVLTNEDVPTRVPSPDEASAAVDAASRALAWHWRSQHADRKGGDHG